MIKELIFNLLFPFSLPLLLDSDFNKKYSSDFSKNLWVNASSALILNFGLCVNNLLISSWDSKDNFLNSSPYSKLLFNILFEISSFEIPLKGYFPHNK